ncbi:hypothetical protein J6590_100499 [Homalodisca vitripennis]|nr:hypothetical protein J6590_100499 [Homalodisca vitripennis]
MRPLLFLSEIEILVLPKWRTALADTAVRENGNQTGGQIYVRPRHDRRKTDARPQLYALAAQTKRETSLTLRPDFHELL